MPDNVQEPEQHSSHGTWYTTDELGPNAPWWAKLVDRIMSVSGILGLLMTIIVGTATYGCYVGGGRALDMLGNYLTTQIESIRTLTAQVKTQTETMTGLNKLLSDQNESFVLSRGKMTEVVDKMQKTIESNGKAIVAFADAEQERLQVAKDTFKIMKRQEENQPPLRVPAAPASSSPN